MASALLGLISCLDRGDCRALDPISVELILDAQEAILGNAGCEQISPAFQGVFHLSGIADVWRFLSNDSAATFDDLSRNKPRSRTQLLERTDRLIVRSPLQSQLLDRESRAQLALAIGKHLKDSASAEDSDAIKLSKLTLRLFS
jgi:hypothetical protein